MNHLRRDGLLFALWLTALPVCSVRAQVAGTFPFSTSSFASVDVRGRMVAFGSDHAASTSNGPGNPPHQPFMIASGLPTLTNMVALDEQTNLRTRMLSDTSSSVALNELNVAELSNSKGEILVNNKDYPPAGVSIEGVNVGAAWELFVRLAPRRQKAHEDELPIDASTGEYRQSESYHWGAMLAQSLFFNVIENSVRTASDDQIRHLLAKKPFWHDYAASVRQFNMRRWNDGDDFLVNYTGHPMQGAVSGFIEIQNDPRGRALEISANREYWESRFKAFLWATAYSVHSEISPIGEAGIGNEGGWTYPIHCKTRCTEPGTYHHYTNNTGWVDFIITPTVGTLWLLTRKIPWIAT